MENFIFQKFNSFMFKPLLAEEVKGTAEPIKDLYTKEQMVRSSNTNFKRR